MIRDRSSVERSPEHALALDCIQKSIQAAEPETAARSNLAIDGDILSIQGTDYDLAEYSEILVVGGGKAAAGMMRALESLLGDQITNGLILSTSPADMATVQIVEGDHPLPSKRNVAATETLLGLVDAADEETLVVFVLTGGASALLARPAGNLTIAGLQATTERLLEGGAPIGAVNAVRKHLSDIKGGQLARRANPAPVAGLVLSDVVGNNLSTIGSGPTAPDETTFADALAVFDRYDIDPPAAVADHLEEGIEGHREETPFPDDPMFESVENYLVSDNAVALNAAQSAAANAGYETLLLSSRFRGEASEVAKNLVAVGEEIAETGRPIEPPAVVVAGGESTVTVTGDGGASGPNQELVLSGALEIDGPQILAAVDTDGKDGNSDAAGAIADAETVTDDAIARDYLARNDAGSLLAEANATIETGPTGTNVNDVIVLVVRDRDV